MKSSKRSAFCLLLLIALSVVQPGAAAPLVPEQTPATEQSGVLGKATAAPSPVFCPMRAGADLGEPRDPSHTLWEALRPQLNDEGLLTGGLVRDFLNNRPYSRNSEVLVEQTLNIPAVVSFVDSYGLYDLAPLAAEKAVNMAKQPVALLGPMGTVNLINVAHYYGKTGRSAISDAIFANLSASLWPASAPKELSAAVLYAYARFLQADGNQSKAKTVYDAFLGMATAQVPLDSHVCYFYSEDEFLPCITDWQPAATAYRAIQSQDYAAANNLISNLLADEKKLTSHQQTNISRLIKLANAYGRHGKKADAQSILEQLLPFTDSEAMLNTRLYILAELYCLHGEETREAHNIWMLLDATANKIDQLSQSAGLRWDAAPIHEERIVQLMDNLALDYAYGNEPAKAIRILKNGLASYPAMSFCINNIWAHLALFEAQVGDYPACKNDLAQSLNKSLSDMPDDLVLARIIDVFSHTGRPAQGEDVAKQIIDWRTKIFLKKSSQAETGSTDQARQQIMENRTHVLRVELSSVRFRYGELLNDQKRFVEAEQILRQVIEHGGRLLHRDLFQYAIALGRSLEGQKKYSDALDIYVQCANSWSGDLSLLQQLVCLMANEPNFGDAEQQKVIDVASHVNGRYMGKYTAKTLEKLLELCRAQSWTEANLGLLQGQLATACYAEGKVDLAKQNEAEKAQRQEALDVTLNALNSGNLAMLKACRSSRPRENEFLCIPQLEEERRFNTAENILNQCIKLMTTSPDSWDRQALIEKSLLAEFYAKQKRFKDAKLLGDEIAAALIKNPWLILKADERYESNYSRNVSDVCVVITGSLQELADRFVDAGLAAEAESLALHTLEVQRKWQGPKSLYIISTYETLERAAKILKNREKEKKYFNQRTFIRNWYLGPPQATPQTDILPPDLFPRSYIEACAYDYAGPTYTAEDLARLKYLYTFYLVRHGHGSTEFYGVLSRLISFYWHTGQYDLAQKLLLEKMRIIEDIEGACGNHKSMCLAEMACLEISKHDSRRAKELLALAQKESCALGKTECAELLMGYAVVEYKLGKKEAAVAMARNAMGHNHNSGIPFGVSPIFVPGAQILADTDLAKAAQSLVPRGGCMPIPPPDPGLFAIK